MAVEAKQKDSETKALQDALMAAKTQQAQRAQQLMTATQMPAKVLLAASTSPGGVPSGNMTVQQGLPGAASPPMARTSDPDGPDSGTFQMSQAADVRVEQLQSEETRTTQMEKNRKMREALAVRSPDVALSRAVGSLVRTAMFFRAGRCAHADASLWLPLPVRWARTVSRRRVGQGQGQGQAVAVGRASHEERQAWQGQVQNAPANPIGEHEDRIMDFEKM